MSILGKFATKHGLSHRPTRTRLNRLLINDLLNLRHKTTCADVASSYFMNTEFFENRVYFGVDISEGALEKGIRSMDDDYHTKIIQAPVDRSTISGMENKQTHSRVGVLGDALEYNLFPQCSLDLITSTHTFSHLPSTEHLHTIVSFQEYLKQGGCLLFNLHASRLDTKIIHYVQDRFQRVEFVYYGNQISHIYDRLISNDDGSVPIITTPVFRHLQFGFAGALSLIEKLPFQSNTMVYIRCLEKL